MTDRRTQMIGVETSGWDLRGIRIGVYVPAYREVEHPGIRCQMAIEERLAAMLGYDLVHTYDSINGIDYARNRVVESARAAGLDYLYMQDSDVYAEGAVIPRLLEIALAHSPHGRPTSQLGVRSTDIGRCGAVSVICPLRRGEDEETKVASVYPCRPGEIYAGERAGTGILLIDVKVANGIAQTYDGPWFRRSWRDRRETELHEGGDMFFSRLLVEHGYQVWIDGTIETVHVDLIKRRFSPPGEGSTHTATPADNRATRDDGENGRKSDAGSNPGDHATTAYTSRTKE